MTPEGSCVESLSVTLADTINTCCVTTGGEVGLRKPRCVIDMPWYKPITPLSPKSVQSWPLSALIDTMVASAVGAKMRRGQLSKWIVSAGTAPREAITGLSGAPGATGFVATVAATGFVATVAA